VGPTCFPAGALTRHTTQRVPEPRPSAEAGRGSRLVCCWERPRRAAFLCASPLNLGWSPVVGRAVVVVQFALAVTIVALRGSELLNYFSFDHIRRSENCHYPLEQRTACSPISGGRRRPAPFGQWSDRNNITADLVRLKINSECTSMRLMYAFLGGVALLCIPIFSAEAATHDRAASLDWRMFQVPEYGTHLEYPAAICAPVGEAEKGAGQRLREKTDRRSCPSTPARMRTTAHLLVISKRTCGNPGLITNGSPAHSCHFNGTRRDNLL
jgi:hypothetical protein